MNALIGSQSDFLLENVKRNHKKNELNIWFTLNQRTYYSNESRFESGGTKAFDISLCGFWDTPNLLITLTINEWSFWVCKMSEIVKNTQSDVFKLPPLSN